MNPIFILAYFFVCYLLLRLLFQDELQQKLTRKQKLLALTACFLYPALFFAPYALEIAPTTEVPDAVYWLPFLLLATAGIVILVFYPAKQKQYTPVLVKTALAVLVLFNLLPLLLTLFEREVLLWIR